MELCFALSCDDDKSAASTLACPEAKPRAKPASARPSKASATPVVRAEVVSADSFAIVLEEPHGQSWIPEARMRVVSDLEATAQIAGASVLKELGETDRCELAASIYLPLHNALVAAGFVTGRRTFAWLSLPSWAVDALPSFGAQNTVDESPATLWLPQGLMSYQQVAVRRALVQGGRVLLADEMGLGKTAEALAVIAQYLDHEGPALIITPSSLVGVWKNQVKQWLPDLRSCEVQVLMETRECIFPQARIVIMSYPVFARKAKAFSTTLEGQPWNIVVCDEAHYLRNPTSLRTKSLLPVLQTARRIVFVTGTPTPKQASDAYILLNSLRPIGCTFKEWCERYGAGRTERREVEVAAMLSEVMVRHMKADVLGQLPPRHRQRVELQLPKSAAAAMRKFQEGCSDEEHFKQLARLKEAASQDYVEYLLDASTQKFLLFGHHRAMLDCLEQVVHKRGIGFIRIDGSTPVSERLSLVNRFQRDPECRVAVLSIMAAGEGLTFTAAALCVFCELCPAVPGVIEQAEARIHRIGQKASQIDVHFLVVDGTRDDRVLARLESRANEVAQATGGESQAIADAGPLLPWDDDGGSRLDLGSDAGPRLNPSHNARDRESSLTGAPAGLKKTRARRAPAVASNLPTAPKKPRRKAGFDLGSILDREMARAKGELSASSSQPESSPFSTESSTRCLQKCVDAPESAIGQGGLSELEVTGTSDASLHLERAPALAGDIELANRSAPARKAAPASDRLSASDMALAFF